MKKNLAARTAIVLSIVLALVCLTSAPVSAQSYNADLIADLGQLQSKLVDLAKAIPADKYSWRPSEGVRSVSEALMHAAQANFFFATQVGIQPPENIKMGTLEQITDKDEAISTLEQSFAQIKKMVEAVPADKLTETKEVFGQTMTNAGLLHAAVSHSHEHLGQMIAYARSMDVVPPWSK
jgi:uncharacterized damage-inducible protein DinB